MYRDASACFDSPGSPEDRVPLGTEDVCAPASNDAGVPEEATPVARARDFDVDLSEGLLPARDRLVLAFERAFAEQMLARHKWNVSRAAAASGVSRRYFQLLMKRTGLAQTPAPRGHSSRS